MKNKIQKILKILLLVLIPNLLVFSNVFAELSQSDILKYMDVRFCNNEKSSPSLSLDLKTWDTRQICFDLVNRSEDFAQIDLNFVDWFIKEWWDWIPNCQDENISKIWLAKYITYENNSILIKPNETIRKYAIIENANLIDWINYACLTIKKADQIKKWWVVNIVMRSVFKIKANYSWAKIVDLKNVWEINVPDWSKLLKSEWSINVLRDNSWILFVELPLKNDWTESINIFVKLNVKWAWWYNFSREDNISIATWEEKNIKFTLPKINFLWWKLDFKIDIEKSLVKEWLAENWAVPTSETYKFSINITEYKNIWATMSLILLIIIIILIMIRRFKKNNLPAW